MKSPPETTDDEMIKCRYDEVWGWIPIGVPPLTAFKSNEPRYIPQSGPHAPAEQAEWELPFNVMQAIRDAVREMKQPTNEE